MYSSTSPLSRRTAPVMRAEGGAAEAQPARPHPQHLLGPHAAREEQQRLDLEGAQGERVSATVKTTNFAIAL